MAPTTASSNDARSDNPAAGRPAEKGGSAEPRPLRVALIGNPNTGKSTLFNALAGMNVRTGNYPGVTVERRTGRVTWQGRAVDLIDLPGTYSLYPRSPDELVAVDVLTGCGPADAPDAVICVCNAAALERNLFLATQLTETGVPTIVCLNMWDTAQRRGISIDLKTLSERLSVPVVVTSASRRTGLDDLRRVAVETATGERPPKQQGPPVLPDGVRAAVDALQNWLLESGCSADDCQHFIVSRGLLDPGGSVEKRLSRLTEGRFVEKVAEVRQQLADSNFDIPAAESRERYAFISEVTAATIQAAPTVRSSTDRLDGILTHRFLGMAICVAVMMSIFVTIYWLSAPLSEGIENGLGWLSDGVAGSMEPGPFRSLLTDGVIAGVGAVLVFLPQIALLFLFIAVLEDCGYMARAAFMMDRVMASVGLSGRSFLPLMSSFACAVPAVMATRVIEDRRDRFVTILIAPLMSCSARLPVYVLMIWTFIPDTVWLGGLLPARAVTLFAMSTLGMVVAIPTAWLLRKTVFKGEGSPFLLELPDYRVPSLRTVVHRVWDSSRAFVVQAGTMIFATSILIWVLGGGAFSGSARYEKLAELESLDVEANPDRADELTTELNALNGRLLSESPLGRFGHFVEPIVKPLGWDWRVGVGVIASFPAREVIIATMGTIFSLGGDVDEEDEGLRGALKSAKHKDGSPLFTIPSALALMVFFALCAQCVSTLVVIGKETNSWKWPVASFVYMTALAWVAAFLTFQIGSHI